MNTGKLALIAAAGILLGGCSNEGLTRSEVDQIVQDAIAAQEPASAAVDAGLSRTEVEKIVQDAIAAWSLPGTPSGDAAPSDAAVAPPRSDQAGYTKFFVDQAINRYEADGLDAALAHYNSADSADGEWYVFVIGENDEVIGHYDPGRLGLNVNEWVGTDINGYVFGPEMLSAPEDGKWVTYVYKNPDAAGLGDDPAGEFQLKNAWVVRHDGLLFGSGWYINTEEFVPALIGEAAEHFRAGGLEAILAFYNDPESISTGLIPTVEYNNRTDTLDGYFAGFIAAPDGQILQHLDTDLIGTDIEDLLGPAVRNATPQGAWITAQDNPAETGPRTMRIWVVDADGTLIGGGWYRN